MKIGGNHAFVRDNEGIIILKLEGLNYTDYRIMCGIFFPN